MHARQRLGVGERRACRVLGQPRTTQRRIRKVRSDEAALLEDVVRLASRFGRYGYRQVTNLLRIEGWSVNHKRVERIWRREGLKVPKRQPKRGRLWLNDGSCIRLRPLHDNHVWSYDFVSTRTADGRALKLLTVLDEYTVDSSGRRNTSRGRSCDGGKQAPKSGSCTTSADAFTRSSADGAPGAPAAFLGGNRSRIVERGGGNCGRPVSRCRNTLVPRVWWNAILILCVPFLGAICRLSSAKRSPSFTLVVAECARSPGS